MAGIILLALFPDAGFPDYLPLFMTEQHDEGMRSWLKKVKRVATIKSIQARLLDSQRLA